MTIIILSFNAAFWIERNCRVLSSCCNMGYTDDMITTFLQRGLASTLQILSVDHLYLGSRMRVVRCKGLGAP
jgi:hypothetical protein